MVALVVPRRLWTRAEYDRMIDAGILGEDDRVELIAGEIVQKMPQNVPHATAIGLGQDALLSAIGPGFHVRIQLPLALGEDSEPEPDLAVISGSRRDYRDEHPTRAVLVIEVADSSLRFDRGWKASLYARSGIGDYWVVNLSRGVLEVFREPVVDERAPLGFSYRVRRRLGPGERISLAAIPSVVILVGDLLP